MNSLVFLGSYEWHDQSLTDPCFIDIRLHDDIILPFDRKKCRLVLLSWWEVQVIDTVLQL